MILLSALVSFALAASSFQTADFIKMCEATDGPPRIVCEAYIHGVLDGYHFVYFKELEKTPDRLCIPDELDTSTARDAVVEFSRGPKAWMFEEFGPAAFTVKALKEKYRCR